MSECENGNEFDGRLGLRISSIFVTLVGSAFGALFPVYASRHSGMGVPEWVFFITKYFGSGVIVATSFIHLLAPAEEALRNECLTGAITEYTWVEGIVLMTVFVLFFVELMTMRYAKFGHSHDQNDEHGTTHKHTDLELNSSLDGKYQEEPSVSIANGNECPTNPHVPGDDHFSHARKHPDSAFAKAGSGHVKTFDPESYAAQLTAIFILEFGVIFHSVFIGLTLAVSGAEFETLYVVLTFHQTFEGLALGSRLGCITWPEAKRFTPYLLGFGYALSTPIAIAIGLGVRTTLDPNSQSFLIINGVFDSISAGILIYTGLVELMAHEFMFSSYFQKAPISKVLSAAGCMVLGALLMAILGKWA